MGGRLLEQRQCCCRIARHHRGRSPSSRRAPPGPRPCPTSDARVSQARAAGRSGATPRPPASIRPYIYCASGTPSAARRSQCAACCSSRSTPRPLSRHIPRLKAAARSPAAAASLNQRATRAGSSGAPAPSSTRLARSTCARLGRRLRRKGAASAPPPRCLPQPRRRSGKASPAHGRRRCARPRRRGGTSPRPRCSSAAAARSRHRDRRPTPPPPGRRPGPRGAATTPLRRDPARHRGPRSAPDPSAAAPSAVRARRHGGRAARRQRASRVTPTPCSVSTASR